jgi:hypothetical protein
MNNHSETAADRAGRNEVRMSMMRSQKGIALVMTLVMLVMLGMLGAFALNTSTTELHIAGNYRNAQVAFNNCTKTEAFGPNNQNILKAIVPYVINSYPTGTGFQTVAMPAGSIGQTAVRVEFICASLSSLAKAQDQEGFLDYHFLVTVIGRGANNSECVVETEVVQTGPRPQGIDPDC